MSYVPFNPLNELSVSTDVLETDPVIASSSGTLTPAAPDHIRNPFKARRFSDSVGFALEGLRYVAQRERNFQIDLACTLLVAGLGLMTRLYPYEWLLLVLVCGLVLFSEAMNTAIELVVDMVTRGEFDARAKIVKDIAAGACLISAGIAAMMGAGIFIPHWLRLLTLVH